MNTPSFTRTLIAAIAVVTAILASLGTIVATADRLVSPRDHPSAISLAVGGGSS